MEKVDLHMHSYHSDGTLDCQMLLDEVLEKGIKMFALTDHDTISGYHEMMNVCKGRDVYFIPGVEIATTYMGKEYHLTTYGYNHEDLQLNDLLNQNMQIRRMFDIEIIKYLEKHPEVQISLNDFLSYEDNPYMGGWPSFNFLKQNKVIHSLGDFFNLLNTFDLEMTFPSPETIIRVAHAAGAVVFLAHPSSNERGGLSHEKLDAFRSFGIDGIECFSPYNQSRLESDVYVAYCLKHDLKISGGSDYHGQFVGRKMGVPQVTSDMISYDFFKNLIK